MDRDSPAHLGCDCVGGHRTHPHRALSDRTTETSRFPKYKRSNNATTIGPGGSRKEGSDMDYPWYTKVIIGAALVLLMSSPSASSWAAWREL